MYNMIYVKQPFTDEIAIYDYRERNLKKKKDNDIVL